MEVVQISQNKIPKKAKLFKLTFYRNQELADMINKEFNVISYKPDWQIPFGLMIDGVKIHFAEDEVRVTEWEEVVSE